MRHFARRSSKERIVEAWKEHENILEAVVAKDRKKAETLVRQHLRRARRVYASSTSGD
jgi:DNA-binding GntR family transcriptional regulator